MKTARILCAAACLSLLVIGTASVRSEPKAAPKKAQTAPKQPTKAGAVRNANGRLPNHYGKLGLSDAQRTEVYAVQARYQGEIADLQTKLQSVRERRDTEIQSVLSEDQKKRLAELIAEAKETPAKVSKKRAAAGKSE